MPKTSPEKIDDELPASLFANVSKEAKIKLCAAAIKESPRFCLELLKGLPSDAFNARQYELAEAFRRGGESSDSLAGHALGKSSLALARLMFGKQRREFAVSGSPADLDAWEKKRAKRVAHLFDGEASDSQALRALGWLGAPSEKLSPAKRAKRLDQDARMAFAYARPSIGLALCERLLAHEPEDIARATLPDLEDRRRGHHDPHPQLGAQPLDWRESSKERWVASAAWDKALPKAAHGVSSWERLGVNCAPTDIKLDSLLGLGAIWARLLAGAPSAGTPALHAQDLAAAGSKLTSVCEKLWAKGALSSPSDYALRFMANPLDADAPQIKALAGGSFEQRLSTAHGIWRSAAMNGKAPCGAGIVWDAFVEAHQGLALDIRENPFYSPGAEQCAAFWSLAGDGSLIELGIERGFDPKPVDGLLVAKGFMGTAAVGEKLAPPEVGFIQSPSGVNTRKIGLALQIEGVFTRQAKEAGRAWAVGSPFSKDKSLLHANFSTVALLLGFEKAACALVSAGAGIPNTDEGLAEALTMERASSRKHKLLAKQALWERFALGESLARDSGETLGSGEQNADPARKSMRI